MYKIKEKIENKIDFLMEAVWLIAIFLVPVLFMRNLYNSFEVPKIILFRSLTAFLLFLYLTKLIFYGLPSLDYFKKRLKYFLPATLFVLFVFVSSIFSDVSWFSFFGGWERWVGSLSWLHFLLFSIIVFLNLDKTKIKRIFNVIILTNIVIIIYGFLQYFNLDPFNWSYDVAKIRRIFSTTGQPNFLGSWLLLTMPVIFLKIKENKSWLKFLFVLIALFSFVAIILTKSRGAMVGFLAMVFFIIFLYGLKHNKKISFIILAVFLLIIGLIIYLNVIEVDNFVLTNSVFSRLKSFSNLQRVGKYRLMHWSGAIDLIQKQPVFGYGIATQRFYIPKYYRPEFAIYENPNIYLDHFHNDVLDMIFSLGILGFLFYALFLIYIFYIGVKYFLTKSTKESRVIFCLLAGMIGYWISILFSFHITSALVIFWTFIAIILYLINKNKFKDFNFSFKTNFYKFGLTILIFSLTIIIVYLLNGKLFISSSLLFNAQKAKIQNNIEESIDYHTKSVSFSPNNPFFKQEFALSLYQFAKKIEGNDKLKLYILNHGLSQLKAIPEKLKTIETYIWFPSLLTEKAGLTNKKEDFEKAKESFKEAINFSPQTALIYNRWCQLKVYQKDFKGAEKKCQKALNLYPSIDHPNMNHSHQKKVVNESFSSYINLANIYKEQKDYKKAITMVEKMEYMINKVYKEEKFNILYVYNLFSSLYNKIGDKEKADFYKEQINNILKTNN